MAEQPNTPHPPAGWYADPTGQPMSRYWNGLAWTERTAPLATATTAPPTSAPAPLPRHLTVDESGVPVSPRSRLAATILCGILGVLGVHRFYVGKIGTGVLQLLTGGGLGIWWIVDFVLIVTGGFRDKEGRRLLNWE